MNSSSPISNSEKPAAGLLHPDASLQFKEWGRQRVGPPPDMPPSCAATLVADAPASLACMVTLAFLMRCKETPRFGGEEVVTCRLPSWEKREQLDRLKNGAPQLAKQAAERVEHAQKSGNRMAEHIARNDLDRVVNTSVRNCLGV